MAECGKKTGEMGAEEIEMASNIPYVKAKGDA